FNIVFGEDISLKGSNFTIRKFAKEPISVAHLIRWGTMSAELAAYLWMLIDVGISGLICGETASGKTTTLNALTAFIRHDAKVVSIEETPEVRLFHRNWVREVTRLHTGSPVTMFDLLKAALRQRPDYIIVGEVRGEEARIMFQAIETGHPVLSTMHAGNMRQMIQRLTSDPINVPKTHINSLNIALFQARIEREGKLLRRVISVNEIIGYDPSGDRIIYIPTFIYDADRDTQYFTGASYLLENLVLQYRGWGRNRLPDLYRELEMRKEILLFLAEKRPSYIDVFKTVIEVNRRSIEAVYRSIKEGRIPWLS
ncbi:MAG: flagellar protein FlaI, partial [Thermoprotei archaeon]